MDFNIFSNQEAQAEPYFDSEDREIPPASQISSTGSDRDLYSFDLPIRKSLRKNICRGLIEEAIMILEENFPKFYFENVTVQCSLLSIQFLTLILEKKTTDSLEFYQKNLTRFTNDSHSKVVTRDTEGKKQRVHVKELLTFFMYPNPADIQSVDFRPYMLQPEIHNAEVADYVNRELLNHISSTLQKSGHTSNLSKRKRDSKLENFIKQSIMTLEMMSDELKYKKNPKKLINPPQRNVGLRIAHHDSFEESNQPESIQPRPDLYN